MEILDFFKVLSESGKNVLHATVVFAADNGNMATYSMTDTGNQTQMDYVNYQLTKSSMTNLKNSLEKDKHGDCK